MSDQYEGLAPEFRPGGTKDPKWMDGVRRLLANGVTSVEPQISIASAYSAMDIGSILNAPVIDFGPNPRAMTGHANNGKSRFDPRINRHTGKPHEHRREIARNLSRAA